MQQTELKLANLPQFHEFFASVTIDKTSNVIHSCLINTHTEEILIHNAHCHQY